MCCDKFSKHFKSYIGEDAVYNFISRMIEKVNIVLMKKHFNKQLVIIEKDNENFQNQMLDL